MAEERQRAFLADLRQLGLIMNPPSLRLLTAIARSRQLKIHCIPSKLNRSMDMRYHAALILLDGSLSVETGAGMSLSLNMAKERAAKALVQRLMRQVVNIPENRFDRENWLIDKLLWACTQLRMGTPTCEITDVPPNNNFVVRCEIGHFTSFGNEGHIMDAVRSASIGMIKTIIDLA